MKFNEYLAYLTESKDDKEVFYFEPAPSRTADKPSFGKYIATEEKTHTSVNKEPMTIADFKKKMQLPFLAYAIEVYKKKNLKESKDDNEFSEEDIKTLKQLKFLISSDKTRATKDIFGEKTVARIVVVTPADFGNVDIKIVRHINDKDSLYELEDVSLEEIKKNIPAVVEELEALVKAEIDFDNVWARF